MHLNAYKTDLAITIVCSPKRNTWKCTCILLLFSEIQQHTHRDLAIITSSSMVGFVLITSAFLCVTVCSIKHCIHQRRRKVSVGVDLQVVEPIYDTIVLDPAYAVISQDRKETKITVNDAYNFEL